LICRKSPRIGLGAARLTEIKEATHLPCNLIGTTRHRGLSMRRLAIHILAIASIGFTAQSAFADSCYDLWYERNAIYDDNGYCFKTSLGKRVFDNSDCYTSDPDFTRAEQRRIDQIRREEKRLGCKVN